MEIKQTLDLVVDCLNPVNDIERLRSRYDQLQDTESLTLLRKTGVSIASIAKPIFRGAVIGSIIGLAAQISKEDPPYYYFMTSTLTVVYLDLASYGVRGIKEMLLK